jgi:hypothetical protein
MHFNMKSFLKSNGNHTLKQTLNEDLKLSWEEKNQSPYPLIPIFYVINGVFKRGIHFIQ